MPEQPEVARRQRFCGYLPSHSVAVERRTSLWEAFGGVSAPIIAQRWKNDRAPLCRQPQRRSFRRPSKGCLERNCVHHTTAGTQSQKLARSVMVLPAKTNRPPLCRVAAGRMFAACPDGLRAWQPAWSQAPCPYFSTDAGGCHCRCRRGVVLMWLCVVVGCRLPERTPDFLARF